MLRAAGIGRQSGDAWLLADVDFAIGPGERLALSGPSGSGKTLLLRALALLDPLQAGAVHWMGHTVGGDAVPGYRSHVTYVHQRPALQSGSVRDNLDAPFRLSAHADKAPPAAATTTAWLKALGRDERFLERRSENLSGGEMQIVALLRALRLAPAILLLDEPTASLDAATATSVEALVATWVAAAPRERAYIWVGHEAGQAERVAERELHLESGRLVAP